MISADLALLETTSTSSHDCILVVISGHALIYSTPIIPKLYSVLKRPSIFTTSLPCSNRYVGVQSRKYMFNRSGRTFSCACKTVLVMPLPRTYVARFFPAPQYSACIVYTHVYPVLVWVRQLGGRSTPDWAPDNLSQ